ncbi:MAG: hypothetical protein H0X66_02245 [Verrucomicrobia bacterium]|nr:hypothetical protein [Verrucomicrobiota bacterium]
MLILLCVVVTVVAQQYSHLPRHVFITGWLLLGLMLLLTLYNGRKKIPFLPLANSKDWLQFHIYAGWFTLLLFLLHIRFRFPTGWFEGTLATLYAVVMVSGIVGLFISRSFPKRLTSRGGEVLFETIPIVRRNLRKRAEELTLKSIPDVQASTVADFYTNELAGFFAGPKNYWKHLFEIRTPLNHLLKKVDDLKRFLNEKERGVMSEYSDLVRQKDGLDYHHTLQLTLKLWLFVHIPLTYSLLIFSLVHVILVFAFSGGAR